MEQISNSMLSLGTTEYSVNTINVQYMTTYEEELTANFICTLCMKTFYNANALQNHKNTQHDLHDGEVTDRDWENSSVPKLQKTQTNVTNDLCGFKFIPLYKNREDPTTVHDGLTTRTFSEDTTYLIVTIEDDEMDSDALKRSRLDGFVKKVKPKEAIDLSPICGQIVLYGDYPSSMDKKEYYVFIMGKRGPFTCTFPSTMRPDMQCRQIFFNCCNYSLHYRQEHTKRRKAALRCQVCERRLDRDFYPSDPITAQLNTPNRVTFSCRLCAQTFLDSTEYDKHNRIVHAKIKPHQCSICSKRFTQQGGLQQHMRMHTGIRPFACTFCPKAFTQKAGLDQHLRTHTKVKPFKCVICSKCFSQSVHLRQHMRTHTNIQPFECSICCRRFKQSSHLNFHMRSHVGDGSLSMESYTQGGHDQMDFLNLANLQPVQDGETLYYAAELAAGPTMPQNTYVYSPQVVLADNVLSL